MGWEGTGSKNMVYICEGCGFIFERKGDVTDCPVCGGTNLRAADEQEQKEFKGGQEQK